MAGILPYLNLMDVIREVLTQACRFPDEMEISRIGLGEDTFVTGNCGRFLCRVGWS